VTSASAVRDLAPLPLTGAGIDRAAALRLDEPRLASAWRDPATRVLLVHEATVAVTPDGDALALLAPAAAPAGERFFLGADPDGVAFFAVVLAAAPADGPRFAGVREVGTLLSERDAGLMVHAVGLAGWHRTHRYCGRCGQPTVTGAAGHVRTCTGCGAEHYPRTDPAVIMAVTDDDDRILLGRQVHWPEGRFSTLAGFVEPGESIEQSVRREVFEEAGVTVGEVEYIASQPWPFPSSLMLGFMARATSAEINVDGEEIQEARWFSREDLRAAFESGEVLPPYGISIAARLIELWYGKPLPTRGTAA
jgi:NAD+ diphosphatase